VHEIFLNERIISPLSDYQPSASTLAILENLSIMHHQKRGAQIFKRGEASQKRKIFGRAKNCKNRKYKLCGGAFKMFWNATKQQCEACSDGKEASPKGDACVDRKLSDEERERGQCPPGKRLDPNVPGQVSGYSISFPSLHQKATIH
jgi:hypothetical protein